MSAAASSHDDQSDLKSSSTATTHYEALGVSSDASLEEIKMAHRLLARQHHPDRQTGAAAPADKLAFNRIQTAWECLRDDSSKQRYDEELRIKQSKEHAAIPLCLAEMEVGQDEASGDMCFVHACRCGEEVAVWPEEYEGKPKILVECPGCSFAYCIVNDGEKR